MRKYIIFIILVALIITLSIFQIQSQIDKNKNNLAINEYKTQNINIDQPMQPIRPTNSDVIKVSKNNKYIIMQATAYDLSVQCCSKSYSNPSRGITRNGYNLTNKSHSEAWTISSNKFPMGTKLKLEFPESHKKYNGIYTVRDTGNFKKNVLDVFVGDFGEKVSKKAINFGRVDVKVYIIK